MVSKKFLDRFKIFSEEFWTKVWPPRFQRSLSVKQLRFSSVNCWNSQKTLFRILVNSFEFWSEFWSVPDRKGKPEMSNSSNEPLEYLIILVMKLINSGSINAWQFD